MGHKVRECFVSLSQIANASCVQTVIFDAIVFLITRIAALVRVCVCVGSSHATKVKMYWDGISFVVCARILIRTMKVGPIL